jgi:hypothetical protein
MGNRRRQRRTAPMIHPTLLEYRMGGLRGQDALCRLQACAWACVGVEEVA